MENGIIRSSGDTVLAAEIFPGCRHTGGLEEAKKLLACGRGCIYRKRRDSPPRLKAFDYTRLRSKMVYLMCIYPVGTIVTSSPTC